MSRELIAKLRKAREFDVVIGRMTFTCRRPNDDDAVKWFNGGADLSDLTLRNVIGWSGVTEDDVIGNGSSDPVPFHIDLWKEWVADRSDFWQPIAEKLIDAYRAHDEKIKERAKN